VDLFNEAYDKAYENILKSNVDDVGENEDEAAPDNSAPAHSDSAT